MRSAGVIVLIALLASSCGSLPPPVARPPRLCHASGGGYAPCDPGYHGSGGPRERTVTVRLVVGRIAQPLGDVSIRVARFPLLVRGREIARMVRADYDGLRRSKNVVLCQRKTWTCPTAQLVKGNFTTYSGERGIYHLPSGRLYNQTTPERCYATEGEAMLDGYPRSRR